LSHLIKLTALAAAITPIDGDSGSTATPDAIVQPTDPAQSPNSDSLLTSTVFDPANVIRIASGEAGFNADIDSGDRFGRDHDRAGDINGDGVIDLVFGARSDDDGFHRHPG